MQTNITIPIQVKSDIEKRQAEQALVAFSKMFSPEELLKISKKLENPLVKMKIKSMI
jgi:hypothetical protein